MNRWGTVVVGAALVALIGVLVWKSGRGPSSSAAAPAGSAERAERTGPSVDAAAMPDPFLALKLDADGGLARSGERAEAKDDDSALGLPSSSPKTVRFGVILVQYRGAEFAPPNARSKQEAMALARTLAEAANTDFKAQVPQGDQGSMEDAGRIPRGVLEPAVEYALFMLPRGSVSEPIDTPRGFWIVRRID
jgi:PPIC-type PPIASE domain